MSAADKEQRGTRSSAPTGLVALTEDLESVIAAIRACPALELVGQAGMPQADALPDLPWFDDPRVLITDTRVQAVVLATSTRGDTELAATAVANDVHVWRRPPMGRNFAEAAEVAGLVKRQATVYDVASWWAHVADPAWNELNWPDGFEPTFSEIRVSAPGPPEESWRRSARDTAGGALANDGYALLEALVATRSFPESAAAAVGTYRADRNTTPNAEDTALAMLRYADGGIASVRVTWDLSPTAHELIHHGRRATASLTMEDVTLLNAAGEMHDQRPVPSPFLAASLQRFAEYVRVDARDRAAVSVDRHLAVSAILETIYLAARTNHPEAPRKLYEVQGWPAPMP